MTRFLLDTSTVSAAVWKEPDPGVLAQLREHGGECAVCAPVWHELQYGVRRLPRGKRRSSLEGFLAPGVPVHGIMGVLQEVGAGAVEERARLERAGRNAPFVDGQIAAIAVTSGIPLVTANPTDFKWFKGLTVHNWVSGR